MAASQIGTCDSKRRDDSRQCRPGTKEAVPKSLKSRVWIPDSGYSKISILTFLSLINREEERDKASFECLSLREREREREELFQKKRTETQLTRKLWRGFFRDSLVGFSLDLVGFPN